MTLTSVGAEAICCVSFLGEPRHPRLCSPGNGACEGGRIRVPALQVDVTGSSSELSFFLKVHGLLRLVFQSGNQLWYQHTQECNADCDYVQPFDRPRGRSRAFSGFQVSLRHKAIVTKRNFKAFTRRKECVAMNLS